MTNRLREFNLRWHDEPVWRPENYSGSVQMCRERGIPIATSENASTLMDFQHLIGRRRSNFIQQSPAKMGRITELKKVFAMANANNVEVAVHSFMTARGCSRMCMRARP